MIRLANSVDSTIVNIGAGEEHSIREFAQAICSIVGYDFHKIQFDLSRYVGAKSKVLAVKRLRQLLPNYRCRPLNEGLASTIQWFQSNWHVFHRAQAA